jgi:putative hemolysin
MTAEERYSVRLATAEADLIAAQRLRYTVFVEELGADGPLVDHTLRRERDRFDPYFDHLVLIDRTLPTDTFDHVVGAYRILPCDRLPAVGRFYSEGEFDLGVLKSSGKRLLELGRSCVRADHRGGTAMIHLWNALAGYVLDREIEVLFGVASFHGTDQAALAQPLAHLHHAHLAPADLRVHAIGSGATTTNLLPPDRIDRRTALSQIPALIRAYLRLGGFVGEGAFVDHAFNTTDVCLVMDTVQMSARHRDFYIRKRGHA